jgi:hypothetical protein
MGIAGEIVGRKERIGIDGSLEARPIAAEKRRMTLRGLW